MKHVIKKKLRHETYKAILESSGKMLSSVRVIRSMRHEVFTLLLHKVSLSAYDDKPYIEENGRSTLAYGHHAIPRVS